MARLPRVGVIATVTGISSQNCGGIADANWYCVPGIGVQKVGDDPMQMIRIFMKSLFHALFWTLIAVGANIFIKKYFFHKNIDSSEILFESLSLFFIIFFWFITGIGKY